MTPAIVLGCHAIGLGVIRSLGIAKVPLFGLSYDPMDMGGVSKYLKEYREIPHPEKYEQEFLDELIRYGGIWGGSVLIPTDDATVSVVSKHKNILKNYYIVACPDWEITEQFIDKRFTYLLAEKLGIPIPKTLFPKSREELKEFAHFVEYPCLVKPTHSHLYFEVFRKKLEKVANSDELFSAYDEASNVGVEVMVQEYIPGEDSNGVNYNSYTWNGQQLVEFTAEKVRLSPPQFGVPRVVMSKKIDQILEHGRRLLGAMGHHGFACTEFKKDARDGGYKLMEVNGRHNRSGLLAVQCGVNFPLIEYNHLVTGELPRRHDYKDGIYWIDEFRDVAHSFLYFRRERYSLLSYLRPYLANHIFSIFSWVDPKPFLKRAYDLFRIVFTQRTHVIKENCALKNEGGTIRAK